MAEVSVDTSDLRKLALQMKAAGRNVRRDYRKGLKDVGDAIAADAKARIVDRAPETAALIKVRTRSPATVIVQGGGRDHPVSALLEGHDGQQGAWRHPLFGNREHWYTEKRQPHLYPAFRAHQGRAKTQLKTHVDAAINAAGIRGPE